MCQEGKGRDDQGKLCLNPYTYEQATIAGPKGGKALKASQAPVCAVPPPTSTPGDNYVLYAENQVADGAVLMPTEGARRHLQGGISPAQACHAACSLAGYAVPFCFAVQKSTGNCYWCVGQEQGSAIDGGGFNGDTTTNKQTHTYLSFPFPFPLAISFTSALGRASSSTTRPLPRTERRRLPLG